MAHEDKTTPDLAREFYIQEIDGTAGGEVSTLNSSSTNLANGALFTGTSEEVTDYAQIVVSVYASHASAAGGLSLQQSSDGTNWDITDTYTVAATTPLAVALTPVARYFRLVYTNGGTLTTSLRIQTIFRRSAGGASIAQLEDVPAASGDAGVFILGVRRDGPVLASTTGTAGDYNEVAVDDVGANYVRFRPLSVTRVTADAQIKASAGYIHTISIAPTTATPTAGLISIYDNTAESGTIIFSTWVFATSNAVTITLDCACATGIYVGYTTVTNVSVTVTYI